ncbi:amino acid permease [Lactovum miscens]|uniref:L-asparagine transporter-like permease n=1 Tax=Lactovum miscens TaxID=190387 RepID=A0A841C4I4_9LACT|nr:amino acid permease [Lactovum miscens]MBB5887254.1 L-asparagine transporter-like permease [Lactovum miscens]
METKKQNTSLKSSLQTRHIVMLSLGGAIGSGLFLGSSSAIITAGPAVLLSYILAGLALYVVMFGVGKMVINNEKSEPGMSGIIKPYVGAHWAHFTDWTYWSTWMAVLIAEEAGVTHFLNQLVPINPHFQWIYALIVAILATGVNLYSVKAFGETEYWLAFVKVFVIILLITVGVYLVLKNIVNQGVGTAVGHITAETSFAPNGFKGFLNSLLIVIFSFGGSELAAVTVAETDNPKVAIPKAIRGVLVRIISFYVVPIFLFLELLPWKDNSGQNPKALSPFAAIFGKIGIPGAQTIVTIVIIVAIFSAVNSAIYATSRSLYSRVQSSESGLGKYLSQLNKNQVPVHAIFVSSAVLVVGVVLSAALGDSFWQFMAGSISFTITPVWIVLLISALIMYFKNKEIASPFLIGATLLIVIALSIAFLMQIVTNPWTLSAFALIIVLLAYFSYRQEKIYAE